MAEEFSSDEKWMALLTVVVTLARTLERSGSLNRSIWINQLMAARQWLVEREDDSVRAFDSLAELLGDI